MNARFLGGGTNLVDLMKTGVEHPGDCRYHSSRPGQNRRGPARRAFDRRAGSQQRPRQPSSHRRTTIRLLFRRLLSGLLRSFATWPRRRQLSFSGRAATTSWIPHSRRVQQTHTWIGLRRNRRLQPHPRHPRPDRSRPKERR